MRTAASRRSPQRPRRTAPDRKSTRLNSSHLVISYAVFCLKKKKYQSSLTEPYLRRNEVIRRLSTYRWVSFPSLFLSLLNSTSIADHIARLSCFHLHSTSSS